MTPIDTNLTIIMGTRDPRFDTYIDNSADFARPILSHLREVVHSACPDAEETMKWSMPHYMYRNSILCGMASFKEHCTFGFWNGGQVTGGKPETGESAMGQFGRIRSLADLPADDVIAGYVKDAMKLKEAGVKRSPAPRGGPGKELVVPEALTQALQENPQALATFERFSPSQRREYADWVADAKTEATRTKRVGTAVEWLAEGKSRNWKYEKC